MIEDPNIKEAELYKISKRDTKGAKDLLRNQMIFSTTMLEQSDEKANMLLSVSIYFLIGILVVFLKFESYVHFPFWILIILALGFLTTVLFILYTVKPNFRYLFKLMDKEIKPIYPEYKDRTLLFAQQVSLTEHEDGSSEVVSDATLPIGNMIRANYLLNKNLNTKYKCLDIAFSTFLFSMLMFFVLFVFNFIASEGSYHDHADRKANVLYNFDKESYIIDLPQELIEVSGLSYDAEGHHIFTHNDEKGIVYQLDPETALVQEQITVANKKGDFEGIEILGENILLTTSSGMLYFYNRSNGEVEESKTPFNSDNNVEGLHVHPTEDKLLFACKGDKYLTSSADRGIYTYNYRLQTVDKTPFLEIRINDLQVYAEEIFKDDNKKHSVSQRLKVFAPSGIAIHPHSKDIYVITARRSMLLVYDMHKKIKDVIALNALLIPQPEGICFDAEGNLYISTEGNDGPGKLIRYDYPLAEVGRE